MTSINRAVCLAALILTTTISLVAQRKTENIQGRDVAAGQVIVSFRGLTQQSLDQIVRTEGLDRAEPLVGNMMVLRSQTRTASELIQVLAQRADVSFVEPDYVVHAINTIPNDSFFPNLWGMRNTGQTIGGVAGLPAADIGATQAWGITTGTTSVVVGVIDTGVDYTHPDLAANIWSAPAQFTVNVGSGSLTCPAGSHGFDAINNNCNPMDQNDHGTHVSGTIGAVGSNNNGVVGVNWRTQIMGLRFLDATGSGVDSDAVKAINFAIQAKAIFGAAANVRILSNSWGGGGFSSSLLNAITNAYNNGILFVAAAGNSGSNNDVTAMYPANYNVPNVIAVAATNNNDGLASFSDFGPTKVHLGAPGVNILSTVRGNSYAFFSGTSMATPHVSGAAALVLSVCNLNTDDLKSNLLNNTDPVSSLAGKTTTGGRLNVFRAVTACSPSLTPNFSISSTPVTKTVAAGNSTTFTIAVAPFGGFNGTVNFNVAGLPANATATFSPSTVSGFGSTTLTVITDPATPATTANLTITATSGALTQTTPAALVITNTTPDFTIITSPASVTRSVGQSASYTATVTPVSGFTGTVNLSVTGLPSGITGSFTPASLTSGDSTLNLTIGANAIPATYTLTVKGTSGALTHSSTVSLVVNALPDFSLTASPGSRTVAAGSSTTFTATVTALHSFTGNVALTVGGLPTGATGTFNPTPVVNSGNSTLTITTTSSVAAGTYPLTITGTSAALSHSASVSLVINSSGNFTIAATPSTETIAPGGSGIYFVTVTPQNGFSGTVTFSQVSDGLAGTFNPPSVTLNGTNPATTMFSRPTNVSRGNATIPITITGTSGSLSHSTPVTMVTSTTADFSIGTAPGQHTIPAGGNTSYTVTVTGINGFTGHVGLTVSGLPTGATASFSSALIAATNSSTMTVTAGSNVVPGTYPLTVSGTGGPLSHSSAATLVVSNPDFAISSSPGSQTVPSGNSTSFTATVTSLNGFAGSVGLSVSGLPTGATGSFSPSSISSGNSTLTISTSAAVVAGTYPLTITGTSGTLTHSSNASLVVTGSPDFNLAVTPASETIRGGMAGVFFVTVTPLNGFAGTVTFSLPAGSGASFSRASVALGASNPVTTMLTRPTGYEAAPWTYNLVVTATGGGKSHNAPISLTKTPTADFSIAAGPGQQTISAGGSTTYNVTLTGLNGFTGYVGLTVSGLPAGASASFSSTPIAAPGASTLTISTGSGVPRGTYSLTITGTAAPISHGAPVTLIVQ